MTTRINKTTQFHDAIKPECDGIRADLLKIETRVRALRAERELPYGSAHDLAEVVKNFELATSHIEDARMRIGKVLQWARDGVSILDQPGRAP